MRDIPRQRRARRGRGWGGQDKQWRGRAPASPVNNNRRWYPPPSLWKFIIFSVSDRVLQGPGFSSQHSLPQYLVPYLYMQENNKMGEFCRFHNRTFAATGWRLCGFYFMPIISSSGSPSPPPSPYPPLLFFSLLSFCFSCFSSSLSP